MLFNSLDFALFLPLVFALYWIIGAKRIRIQNFLILVSSYIFYGWWDWRFLSLIFLSSVVDYTVGLGIHSSTSKVRSRALLAFSLVFNLGLLITFKYYNFFIESFTDAFSVIGMSMNPSTIKIILPVGISFYTFQTLSYSIDIYRKQLKPTKDIVAFFAFVSFFPQLVAGPIERASNLVPQFLQARKFEYGKAVDGMRQMLWGLFKKVVIADNCAALVNEIFGNSESYPSVVLLIGAVLFAFQIYGDFSGYSDMAIGMSRLFGFDLMRNFAFPYFARDIAEFWRRWHISLSTWFRDYLYIPLGGSRTSRNKVVRNVMIVFLVSGFWHGANWTFIVWGGLHGLFFLPLLLAGRNRQNLEYNDSNKWLPDLREGMNMLGTFLIVCLAWVFFRAENIGHAMNYVIGIFSYPYVDSSLNEILDQAAMPFLLVAMLLTVEWVQRFKQHGLEFTNDRVSAGLRYLTYYGLLAMILIYGESNQDFIYFQF